MVGVDEEGGKFLIGGSSLVAGEEYVFLFPIPTPDNCL